MKDDYEVSLSRVAKLEQMYRNQQKLFSEPQSEEEAAGLLHCFLFERGNEAKVGLDFLSRTYNLKPQSDTVTSEEEFFSWFEPLSSSKRWQPALMDFIRRFQLPVRRLILAQATVADCFDKTASFALRETDRVDKEYLKLWPVRLYNAFRITGWHEFALETIAAAIAAYTTDDDNRLRNAIWNEYHGGAGPFQSAYRQELRSGAWLPDHKVFEDHGRQVPLLPTQFSSIEGVAKHAKKQITKNLKADKHTTDRFGDYIEEIAEECSGIKAFIEREDILDTVSVAKLSRHELEIIEALVNNPGRLDYGSGNELANLLGRPVENIRQEKSNALRKLRKAHDKHAM